MNRNALEIKLATMQDPGHISAGFARRTKNTPRNWGAGGSERASGSGRRARVIGALALVMALLLPGAGRAQDEVKYATDNVGIVPYWLGLGPIAISLQDAKGPGLDTDLVGGETTANPAGNELVTVAGRKMRWRLCTIKNGGPVIDGASAGFGNAENVAVYFVTYLSVDKDTTAVLYWSTSGCGKVLLNGKEIGRYVGQRECVPDVDVTAPLTLKAGSNTLMIKVVSAGSTLAAFARFVTPDGWPLKDITLDRAPAGKDASGRNWKVVSTRQEDLEGPLSTYLVAGQFGYLPAEEKMAIATSRGDRKWTTIEIRDAKTDQPLFHIPDDGGSIVPMGYYKDVNQYISRVFFGPFKTPGRYYLYNKETTVKSFPFDIQDDVYARAANVLTRMFYYQRTGIDWNEKYAGKWARPAYNSIEEMTKGTLHSWAGGAWTSIGGPQTDPTPYDVRGGWYDAGDPNKYTKNESMAHDILLVAYDLNKANLKDGDLDIPESGNGVPDLVDEARFTTDYLMRIQLPDGRVFDRVALGARYDLETDKKTDPATEIAEPCSGATLCSCGALAYAAAVWQEGGWDKDYAKKCLDAALLSWNYMKAHPSPWPVTVGGKPKPIGSIDGGYDDEERWRALAAAALYRATGEPGYKMIAELWLKDFIAKAKTARGNEVVELGYKSYNDLVAHVYMTGKDPDPALMSGYGTLMADQAKACRDQVGRMNKTYAYGAGLPNYHWGATGGLTSRAAWMLWWARNFAPKSELSSYVQAAHEYLQFLFGRNPRRMTYVTNLGDWGASRSPMVMYHTTVINLTPKEQDRFLTPDADHPDRIGVMPGYMVGGPVSSITDFNFDPQKMPSDFQHMEPSIMYQCHGVLLATTLAAMK